MLSTRTLAKSTAQAVPLENYIRKLMGKTDGDLQNRKVRDTDDESNDKNNGDEDDDNNGDEDNDNNGDERDIFSGALCSESEIGGGLEDGKSR